ncbi:hypothetical protein OG2516_02279 [Oceanicola granulosus HTCC2516]|uniref:Adenylosuccinate lyase n=1 Tax=Oceanicola granulosus (strain ATCC BAA-861 / DSM 15982 / KCTC 12143 / HTCC2516) TaxID=314256 RepID=Q2CHR8_OCEGH|nr:carbohydrate-binding module family 14 protein [Oceanicola granulosus]EAR52226.1 hypothetical protein OG2516_02279 [Oceanicola granulosus HTCC2516]
MKIAVLFVLTLFPTLALAQACDHDQAMSCADGMIWDPETGTCEAVVTG